jgi:hypothetical protein
MLLNEIRVNNSQYNYKFYLKAHTNLPQTIGRVFYGRVIEKGANFVRVRKTTEYRGHKDYIIPRTSILYFTEEYSAE